MFLFLGIINWKYTELKFVKRFEQKIGQRILDNYLFYIHCCQTEKKQLIQQLCLESSRAESAS
jgi:hypothetical protein